MESGTIIGRIMNAVDPKTGEKCSEDDLLTNANLFVYFPRPPPLSKSIAASDTTAVTLTFLLYYLLAERKYWDRLAAEIRSKFPSPELITNSALLGIPFLEAAINESTSPLLSLLIIALRIRPAVPTNLQRETPPEGMMIAGQFVPGEVISTLHLSF